MQPSFELLGAFTIEKEPGIPNEDRFLVSEGGHAIAVCDGASQSYDSAAWAELLCRAFIQDQSVDRAWISHAAAEYNSGYALSDLPWMKQAAFERGSFSTLLGIEALPAATVRVTAFGDSLLVLADRDRFVASCPYQDAKNFDADPQLISTSPIFNAHLTDEFIQTSTRLFDLKGCAAPIILLMTDALGRWVLERKDDPETWRRLLSLDQSGFAQLIQEERASRRMRKDDSTLLLVGIR
jgi:hypothetical protein